MKPTSFFDLPWTLQEELLWRMDTLDYDSYESSKAECINEISNGLVSNFNECSINNFYKNVSVETLQRMAKQAKENCLLQISALDKIIG